MSETHAMHPNDSIDGCPCGACQLDRVHFDPAAFWRHLKPEQALALLRVAPRVAGPRERVRPNDRGSYRYGPNGKPVPNSYACLCETCASDSKHLSEANVDARLMAAGWLLVGNEAEEGRGQ